ncbi:MAG: dihydropteroate synthase [Candidatus Omnitrophota bacterium]
MGILNVTPDSFSDGGRYFEAKRAIERAYQLAEEGADIIDVGGESSRPGAEAVSEEEELRRVFPVIREAAGKGGLCVSIDTVKYAVAAKAVEAGAAIVNDISGLQNESRLADLAAESGAGLILMHMRGNPRTMQSLTEYCDLAGEIRSFFERQVQEAQKAGVESGQIVLDPGIGFGKTAQQNLSILSRLERIRLTGYPLLIGVSRKSFIGITTGKETEDRLMGTIGAAVAGIMNGADIVRVHDAAAMRDAAAMADAIRRESLTNGESQ